MIYFIVIFSFSGFMYAIEPSSQQYCDKEALEILARFTEKDKTTTYYGGCVPGGILLNIKMDDA